MTSNEVYVNELYQAIRNSPHRLVNNMVKQYHSTTNNLYTKVCINPTLYFPVSVELTISVITWLMISRQLFVIMAGGGDGVGGGGGVLVLVTPAPE